MSRKRTPSPPRGDAAPPGEQTGAVTTTEQTEIERKYDVADGAAVPPLAGVGPVATATTEPTAALRAVYHDTADRALLGARVTLRRRTGGGDEGWHLKLPGDRGRREVHHPLGADDEAVPEALVALVADLLEGRATAPVLVLETARTPTRLRAADGTELAELADDAVTASDPGSDARHAWHEWELELAPDLDPADGTGLFEAVEPVLLAAGARPSSSRSKLARGLAAVDGQAGGASPDAPPAPVRR